MASFNKVILMGNLTRDPQLRYLPSQTAVVDFGLACNRKWKGQNGEDREEVLFVDCSAFGRPAEVINEYCRKGRPLFVEGRLKLDQWEDKQGGGKRSKLTVVVENFQLLGSRDGGPSAGGDDSSQAPPAQRPQGRPQQQRPAQQPPFSQEENFKSDDIPF
ncbi:MAG TPA: single-stranded DNA-binding protein [Tepidisphaeraceae bacterium]|nr:single-stranded DNA-binding protein [Tepidisphaeraceae bacterium]